MGYKDINGNPVTLEKLVRDEPGWACSRIRAEAVNSERIQELEEEREEYRASERQLRELADERGQRIRELEEEKANLMLHVTDMRDWNNRASAHSEKVQAENKRLRQAIQQHKNLQGVHYKDNVRLWKALESE